MSWLWKWFTDRWPYYQLKDLLLNEEIPGGASFSYTLGSSLLVIFTLQVVSGILQLFYYVPTIDHAYNSVGYLRTEVPFGWLIHNMHYWGANAMVFIVALHMIRVYTWGAYKKTPLTWFFGIALVVVTMAMSFTGAPLIWDQKGYWAGEVGSSIAGEVPIVGGILETILRGGATMGQLTLSRFFVFHVGIFAPLLGLLIAMHIASFRTSGVGGPWEPQKQKKTGPFWPDQAFKDLIVATVVFVLLVICCVYFPVPFAGAADPLNTSYVPKPEWNFLFVYQALKYFKGPWEPIGAAGVPAVFVTLLILVPLVDRNRQRNPFRRPVAMTCLVLYTGLILTLSVIGYLSPGLAQPVTAASSPKASSKPAGKQQQIQSQQQQRQQKPSESPQLAAAIEKGRKVFDSQGCTACHKVDGKGGSIGPELSGNTLVGKSRKWLEDQVRTPKSHFPGTVMPSFVKLSKEDLDNLVSYLMSLVSGGQPAASSSSSQPSPKSSAAQEQQQQKTSASSRSAMERGKQIFDSSGCRGCHKVHGKGGSVGPELAGPTLAGKSRQWLMQQITNSRAHFPSMGPNTGMTEFTAMGKEQLNDLVDYLMSLVSGAPPPSGQGVQGMKQKPAPPAAAPPAVGTEEESLGKPVGKAAFIIGSAENGADLFRNECVSCHGPDARGGVKNPGSDDGTVPPLNPIDRALYNTNPKIFAETIDKIIQHGSMPSGPHPALHMPAWGDSRSLTQQEIANLEAYIMKLNGVDRGKLMQPGIEPPLFFFLMIGVIVVAVLILGGMWSRRRH
jgi:ubiquinol-cytochrome c reductase cytochrome b subunit